MRKLLRISAALVLALVLFACERDLSERKMFIPDEAEETDYAGKQVRVQFSIPGVSLKTKALGEGGELNTLHLAVFGGSGYLKEYVQASVDSTWDYTYKMTNQDNDSVSVTVPAYRFSADLSMSDSPRTVHLIGNGPSTLPFGYDNAVMPVQLSANGEMGYWQVIDLPHGIRARRDAQGNFINAAGEIIPDGGTGYVPDDSTALSFQGIALVRNWAKIVLTSADDSNFEPKSLAVINVPSRGALAPYSSDIGFIRNYQNHSFTFLDDTVKYAANLPAGTLFDSSTPPKSEFEHPSGGRVAPASGAVYLYERPAPGPQIPPTFVIIYGHYSKEGDEEHEGDYFYKVDLMETKKVNGEWTSRYYPIYRNFKYQIYIKSILSPGHSTPEAAAAAAGSADVSADVTTGHLAEISDGVGRLHLTPWMSKTFTRAHDENNPVDVLNVFFSKTVDGEADMDPASVKVELLPPEDGRDDIIYNLQIGAPVASGDSKGWRPITFCTREPGKVVRSQTIRITGTHDSGRLYRDVIITIQPIQPMSVDCSNHRVDSESGQPQVLTINIPDGLGQSMFPLDFTIEPEDMTLTPDNSVPDNNLPVISGTSISEHDGYAGKPTFQFIRTVTWEEYLTLPRHEDEEELMWRSFTASFKTTRAEAGTTVWVYNEFFDKTSVGFTHFVRKYFQNLAFLQPVREESDQDLTLRFEMVEEPGVSYPSGYPDVLVMPHSLRFKDESLFTQVSPGVYSFHPTGHVVEIEFVTTTSFVDEVSVNLSAEDYDPGHVGVYRFPLARFLDGHPLRSGQTGWADNLWSNTAWGYINKDGNKTVLFGYKDHPEKMNTPVTVSVRNGLTPQTTFPYIPTGPRNVLGDENYHEIEFRTIAGTQDVEIELSSPGYVPQTITTGRFVGNIRTMKITGANVLKPDNTYGFAAGAPASFTHTEDNGKCTVTFSEVSALQNGYVDLAAGGTYTMTVTSNNSSQTLFYINIIFSTQNGKVLRPESFSASVGEVSRYYGSNDQYVWNIPRGNLTGSVTMTAPADTPIRIKTLYVKSYNGYLMENGSRIQ